LLYERARHRAGLFAAPAAFAAVRRWGLRVRTNACRIIPAQRITLATGCIG